MLSLGEFYSNLGETGPTDEAEQIFVNRQIMVGTDAVRNYCNRFFSPMVWEDRFQYPDIIHLVEYPVVTILAVIADGYTIPETDYWYDRNNGRLYRRATLAAAWVPWGMHPLPATVPDTVPYGEYFLNWRGIVQLTVLYKSGLDVMPPVLQMVVSDYAAERLTLLRAAKASGGGSQLPAGSVSSVSIDGVGTIKYAGGSTTTSTFNASRGSGLPVIGSAGPLLDAYREVAIVVPGIRSLISHHQALFLPEDAYLPSVQYSDLPIDRMLYTDDPEALIYWEDPPVVLMTLVTKRYPQSSAVPSSLLLSGGNFWLPWWDNVV
jgi:hypothetical protein